MQPLDYDPAMGQQFQTDEKGCYMNLWKLGEAAAQNFHKERVAGAKHLNKLSIVVWSSYEEVRMSCVGGKHLGEACIVQLCTQKTRMQNSNFANFAPWDIKINIMFKNCSFGQAALHRF